MVETEPPPELLLEELTLLVIRVSKFPRPKEILEDELLDVAEDVEKADAKELLPLAKAEVLVDPVERKLVLVAESVTKMHKKSTLSNRPCMNTCGNIPSIPIYTTLNRSRLYTALI